MRRLRGWLGLLRIGRQLGPALAAEPDGLLTHESHLFGLNHVGMRQYWRHLESLERFTRAEPRVQ